MTSDLKSVPSITYVPLPLWPIKAFLEMIHTTNGKRANYHLLTSVALLQKELDSGFFFLDFNQIRNYDLTFDYQMGKAHAFHLAMKETFPSCSLSTLVQAGIVPRLTA